MIASSYSRKLWSAVLYLPAAVMLAILLTPIAGLVLASSPTDILAGVRHPLFASALWLSAKTTLWSLLVVVVFGTPLAWWLARASGAPKRWVETFVDLPMVLPPAVIGIALLSAFGRNGFLGPLLNTFHLQIPFTTFAVVMAQVTVSAPFYIQAAAAAFGEVDQDLVLVARTLGQSSTGAFFRVVVPIAIPGLITGAALSWGRALGEFGATLLFAGNLPGRTQTMPLAIYTALESDVRAALALSLVLAGFGVLLLFAIRLIPRRFSSRQESPSPQEIVARRGSRQ